MLIANGRQRMVLVPWNRSYIWSWNVIYVTETKPGSSSQYNILSLHNVICTYIYRAEHLAWDNQLIYMFLPGENYHSCSQYSSVSYSSVHRIVALWDFPPFTLGCQLVSLLLACVWIAVLVRLYGCSLWYYLETQSHGKLPILWLLHWFLVVFLNVP